jgi:ribosome-associated translation inhibitor RaiA
MNTRIKTTDYSMPKKVADYLDERLFALEKLLGDDAENSRCEVELGLATGKHKHSEHQWFVEIQIKRPRERTLVARNHEATINAAIDNARNEMRAQLAKRKTLKKSKVRKDAAKAKRLLRD